MIKVAYFAVERLAEPFSAAVGAVATRSPIFQAACRGLARHIDRRSTQKPGRFYRPLTDEQASKAGAAILGEAILWTCGLAVLTHQTVAENEEEACRLKCAAESERRIMHLEYEVEKWASRCQRAGIGASNRSEAGLALATVGMPAPVVSLEAAASLAAGAPAPEAGPTAGWRRRLDGVLFGSHSCRPAVILLARPSAALPWDNAPT